VTTYAEKEVLALQGGGALGAYQAGAYEALCDAGHMPSWVAGTSIGAINAAIIAGNPPEQRASRLREFWQRVSSRLIAWPLAPMTARVGFSTKPAPRFPPSAARARFL
jgi:NTE family protein